MTAGILQGAPVTTVDLDLVHRRSPENVARLLRVLAELEATFLHDPRGLRPAESHLVGPGHQLLTTRLGDIDCLGTVDQDRRYEDLLPLTVEMTLGGADGARPGPPRTDRSEGAGRPSQGPRRASGASRDSRRAEPAILIRCCEPGPPHGASQSRAYTVHVWPAATVANGRSCASRPIHGIGTRAASSSVEVSSREGPSGRRPRRVWQVSRARPGAPADDARPALRRYRISRR